MNAIKATIGISLVGYSAWIFNLVGWSMYWRVFLVPMLLVFAYFWVEYELEG